MSVRLRLLSLVLVGLFVASLSVYALPSADAAGSRPQIVLAGPFSDDDPDPQRRGKLIFIITTHKTDKVTILYQDKRLKAQQFGPSIPGSILGTKWVAKSNQVFKFDHCYSFKVIAKNSTSQRVKTVSSMISSKSRMGTSC